MSIGLITTTTYSGKTKNAFLAGLRANGWEGNPSFAPGANTVVSIVPYAAEGNYGNLVQVIQSWNQDSDINLIVSVGGLITALASNHSTNTPFIALYGTAPNPDFSGSTFCGGVDLNLIAQDSMRNAKLSKKYGIDATSICLIWNAKSAMGRDEQKAWRRSGWPDVQVKNNKDQDITEAFTKAKKITKAKKKNGAKGIVVSGDPFFTNRMDVLVKAANDSKLKICYPFKMYKGASPPPNGNNGLGFGPDLVSAYEEMGERAAKILTALKAGEPAPYTKPTKAEPVSFKI